MPQHVLGPRDIVSPHEYFDLRSAALTRVMQSCPAPGPVGGMAEVWSRWVETCWRYRVSSELVVVGWVTDLLENRDREA